MRAAEIARQPFLAGEEPHTDPLRVEKGDDLARDIALDAALVEDLQRRRDDRAAIESGNRDRDAERIDQHAQPEGRTAAHDREADAARMQRGHRRARALRHAFLRRHQRAVDIRDHQRDTSHSSPLGPPH